MCGVGRAIDARSFLPRRKDRKKDPRYGSYSCTWEYVECSAVRCVQFRVPHSSGMQRGGFAPKYDTYYFAMSKKFYETKIESIENIQNESFIDSLAATSSGRELVESMSSYLEDANKYRVIIITDSVMSSRVKLNKLKICNSSIVDCLLKPRQQSIQSHKVTCNSSSFQQHLHI